MSSGLVSAFCNRYIAESSWVSAICRDALTAHVLSFPILRTHDEQNIASKLNKATASQQIEPSATAYLFTTELLNSRMKECRELLIRLA